MLVKCNYNIVGASASAALPLLEDRELEGPEDCVDRDLGWCFWDRLEALAQLGGLCPECSDYHRDHCCLHPPHLLEFLSQALIFLEVLVFFLCPTFFWTNFPWTSGCLLAIPGTDSPMDHTCASASYCPALMASIAPSSQRWSLWCTYLNCHAARSVASAFFSLFTECLFE